MLDNDVLIPLTAFEPIPLVATDENIAHFIFPGFKVLSPIKKARPASPEDLLPSHPEVLQPVDEVQTRVFHTTMNQKASNQNTSQKASKSHTYATRLEAPSPARARRSPASIPAMVIDPTPAFVASIYNGFQELLQGLRGFQGEVVVRAEFGRILMKRIPRKLIAPVDSEASIHPDTCIRVLENPNGGGPLAVFTKVLSSLPADISYLVKLKDRYNQDMWKQNQPSWDVSYEVLIMDTRSVKHHPFTIEIDGENFKAQVKVRREFGEINIHGLKRHWDFRISASGADAEGNIDPAYIKFAEAVKDSLHIP